MNSDKPVQASNVPTPAGQRQVPREEIALLAERIWNERNRPTDMDDAIWLEAESRLQAEMEAKPVAGTPSRPYADEPAQPVRSKSKSRDPADAAAQTRSPTPAQPKQPPGKLRSQ